MQFINACVAFKPLYITITAAFLIHDFSIRNYGVRQLKFNGKKVNNQGKQLKYYNRAADGE